MSDREPTISKVELPVSGKHSALRTVQDLDKVVVANSLITSDKKNLAMISNIPNAMDLTIIEGLKYDAKIDGMDELAGLYDVLLTSYRENSTAVGGERVKTMEKILSADFRNSRRDEDDESALKRGTRERSR